MSQTTLILVLFSVDILVHLAVTILVGLWLNKVARREVERAAGKVANGLAGFLGSSVTTNGREKESADA